MKVNLISEATYGPARVAQKSKTSPAQPINRKAQSPESSRFEKLLLEKLSHDEAAAINRLFGEFKMNSTGELKNGNSSPGDVMGSVSRGKFVDITV
jgi:hypothetical protein